MEDIIQVGRPGWIGRVAQFDPVLAYNLARPQLARAQLAKRTKGEDGTVGACGPDGTPVVRPDLIGWGEPSCGWGWEIINLTGTWTSGAADQLVEGQMTGIVEADLWIRKVMYTVQRPLAFPGSVFKAQSDEMNKKNPNINFELTVKSYCQYVIANTPTPLENIEVAFECVCPVGFVLGCSSQMSAQFTNLRALADDEIPTNAVISFHAVRLPTRYDNCGVNVAVAELMAAGLLDPGYEVA